MVIRMKNKRGWIEIVEAFVAILLIAGVLLIVLTKGDTGKGDISKEVYDVELSILREIQLNDTLRADILSLTSLPVEWEDFPINVKQKIIERTPENLNCIGKICEITDVCNLGEEATTKNDVYAQAVGISPSAGNPLEQSYRKINLFCWAK